MERDYSTCFDRSYNIMEQFCHPLPLNNSWAFWKNYLLGFNEVRTITIYEIETVFPQLIDECADSIYHCCISNKNGLYFHQHMSIEKDTLLPLDEKRNMDVNIGGDGLKMIHYQNYKDFFNKSKQEYFNSYKILMDMQTFDFTRNNTNYCGILQTIRCFLNETCDNGFAFKGYSLGNHYAMIGQSIIPKEQISKHILAYFSNKNILMHIKISCDKNEISKLLNNFPKEVQFAQSVHECISDNAVVHIGVVLIDDSLLHDQSIYPYKKCVEKHLMLPKSCFSNTNSFKEWYEKLVKRNENLIQIYEQIYENKEMTNNLISKELKENIISQMAIKSHDFPTFTPLPQYQIQELDKIVLLSPCQMNVLYSPHKHIFIRGGYGSGKSIILQKLFEQRIEESDENDIFYLICFDDMSKYADQMKLLKAKYPEKFICVFNKKEMEDPMWKLSHILHLIKDSWKSRTVNIFIDEFNGGLIDNDEVNALKEELKFFSNSHIVIAAQSMEYELLDEIYESKFQYDLLASETSFELYHLDYSLRCSVEITNFVNHSIDVLSCDPVLCNAIDNGCRVNYNGCRFDQEFGMQFCNDPINKTAKRLYTFNKAKDIGHGVACQKVQLYTSKSGYQMILMLHHLLSEMEEEVVVCTFRGDIYNCIYKMLKDGALQWTTNITDFFKRKLKLTILLTDYASIRGFEFKNFIFMFDLTKKYMNYCLIEIFSRATTNLYLIVNTMYNKQLNLVECWKTLECVELRELSFNEKMSQYVLKSNNRQEILFEHSVLTNIFRRKSIEGHYPWHEMTHPDNQGETVYDEMDLRMMMSLWIIIMKNDDIKLLNELIKIHAINIRQYNILLMERNLLHLVAKYNAIESCKYLLEKYHRSHIDVNNIVDISSHEMNVTNCCHCKKLVDMKDSSKFTPLHYAVENNNETIANIFVNHGADVNVTHKLYKTSLHYAIKYNNETIVNILLDHGADVNITDELGKTPLYYAATYDNETIVNVLLHHGADVNITDKCNRTPFHYAVENHNEAIVNILLKHGADVNIITE